VVARRWRGPTGELDIVAFDTDGTLVGIEVKLRRTGRAGGPLDAIDRRRVRRQRAALTAFRATERSSSGQGLRIDLVAVRPAADGRWRLSHLRAIDEW
jgi:putative endonuclease